MGTPLDQAMSTEHNTAADRPVVRLPPIGKLTAGGQPAEGKVARAERAKLAREAIQVQADASK